MTKKQKEQVFLQLGISSKISAATIIVLAVIAGLSYFAYIQWIEPQMEASSLEDSRLNFGARKFHIPQKESAVAGGEAPYRLGKVLGSGFNGSTDQGSQLADFDLTDFNRLNPD